MCIVSVPNTLGLQKAKMPRIVTNKTLITHLIFRKMSIWKTGLTRINSAKKKRTRTKLRSPEDIFEIQNN